MSAEVNTRMTPITLITAQICVCFGQEHCSFTSSVFPKGESLQAIVQFEKTAAIQVSFDRHI